MGNIDELFDNDENIEPETWINKTDTPEYKKYVELISKLESLSSEFKQEDFSWLKSNNRTYEFGYENNQFHYFVYCIDWSELYGIFNSRLTIYDILATSNSKKKKKSKFKEAYAQIRKLFNGNIASAQDLIKCRDIVLNKISEGLTSVQTSKGFKSKGLNEFFKMLFGKIGNVDYELNDFTTLYLTGESQKSRFIIDVFDKIIPAFEVTKKFNKDFKNNIPGVEIDNFFVMHVLLRHTATFKFKEIYFPISENAPEIMDGLKKKQKVTANTNSEGFVSVISQDGVFYPPNFSCEQNDFLEFKSKGEQIRIDELANNLYKKLNLLIPKFVGNINFYFSPNIIYFENCLYGFEFPTWKCNEKSTIELFSCYPLNSEYQLEKGISQKDIDKITNKSSIPESYEMKIEK